MMEERIAFEMTRQAWYEFVKPMMFYPTSMARDHWGNTHVLTVWREQRRGQWVIRTHWKSHSGYSTHSISLDAQCWRCGVPNRVSDAWLWLVGWGQWGEPKHKTICDDCATIIGNALFRLGVPQLICPISEIPTQGT